MSDVHELTVADVLVRGSRLFPERPALIGPEGTLSFRTLNDQADRVAAGLRAVGVSHGDRVAILSQNSAAYVVLIGALAKLGAIAVPINARLRPGEIAHTLRDSAPRLICVQPALREALPPECATPLVLLGDAAAATPGDRASVAGTYDDLLRHTPLAAAAPVRESDLIALIYTAAVDGAPRGAMISHKAFVYQNLNMGTVMGITPDDVYLNFLPLFHTGGLSLVMTGLHAGAASVIPERFDPLAGARLVQQHRVTILVEFAPMAARLLEAADANGIDLSSLRIVGGLDFPDTIALYLQRFPGLTWYGGYGQTETHGLALYGTVRTLAELQRRPQMPGREPPLSVVRVVDAADNELPPGAVGEIVVRGPNTALGYWNQPELSAHLLRGGWWHTGDLGRRDAEGYIWFVDRKDDKALIKTGGENVYPQEVEGVLRCHPAVQDVCVIGVTDPDWGEAVKAVVVLREAAAATAADLIEFCRQQIASYKKPRYVEFTAALPRNGQGTVDRQVVKQQFGQSRP